MRPGQVTITLALWIFIARTWRGFAPSTACVLLEHVRESARQARQRFEDLAQVILHRLLGGGGAPGRDRVEDRLVLRDEVIDRRRVRADSGIARGPSAPSPPRSPSTHRRIRPRWRGRDGTPRRARRMSPRSRAALRCSARIARRSSIAALPMPSLARRAIAHSTASRTKRASVTALAEIFTTKVPRCGSTRTSPISDSLMKASRTGWRLTLSRPAMSCSDSAVAGVSRMVTIEERSVRNTCSAIEPARASMRRGIDRVDLRVALPELPYYHFSLTRPPNQPAVQQQPHCRAKVNRRTLMMWTTRFARGARRDARAARTCRRGGLHPQRQHRADRR